jgi:ATPase subunit of ABC transporter with duplicated ATPase domains
VLQGAKIGVLGANGAGKSSLMRILAGEDNSFDGRVVRAPGIRWEGGMQAVGHQDCCSCCDGCCNNITM